MPRAGGNIRFTRLPAEARYRKLICLTKTGKFGLVNASKNEPINAANVFLLIKISWALAEKTKFRKTGGRYVNENYVHGNR